MLLDLALGREATVARVTKGFIVPLAFEHRIIVYRKDFAGQEGTDRFDMDITKITEWKELV